MFLQLSSIFAKYHVIPTTSLRSSHNSLRNLVPIRKGIIPTPTLEGSCQHTLYLGAVLHRKRQSWQILLQTTIRWHRHLTNHSQTLNLLPFKQRLLRQNRTSSRGGQGSGRRARKTNHRVNTAFTIYLVQLAMLLFAKSRPLHPEFQDRIRRNSGKVAWMIQIYYREVMALGKIRLEVQHMTEWMGLVRTLYMQRLRGPVLLGFCDPPAALFRSISIKSVCRDQPALGLLLSKAQDLQSCLDHMSLMRNAILALRLRQMSKPIPEYLSLNWFLQ